MALNTKDVALNEYCNLCVLCQHNVNLSKWIERLDMEFDALKKQLVGKLHDILRRELFGEVSSYGNDILKENSLY